MSQTATASPSRPRRFLALLGCVAAGAIVAVASVRQASAERMHPDFPATIIVGASSGPQPMMRSDVHRTGQATRLPEVPRELWHRKIRGGLSLPVAVDANGSIVIAASVAELVQVSPDGNEQWHHAVGMSVATAGPAILSDGTRVAITALGEMWGFRANGSVRFQTDLSRFGADPRVAPLPRDNGHVVVAVANNLIDVDSDGSIADRVELPERLAGMLVASGQGIVATGEGGKIYVWQAPLAPRLIGSFGGLVREGALLLRPGVLAAVVDNARLVQFDISTGAATTSLNLLGMEGPPAVGPRSTLFVSGTAGMLVGMSGTDETTRVSLMPAPVVDATDPDAGAAVPLYSAPSPPLVADREGRIAFVRSNGRVGVVSATGAVNAVANPACSSPISLVPAGDRKFLVACRNGSLKLYGP